MATSLADLLTEVSLYAENREQTPELAAEAVAAIGQFGRCLPRFSWTEIDPDIAARQTALVGACMGFYHGAEVRSGRLRDLAGAAADLAAIMQNELDERQRWAVFIEVNDTLHDLVWAYRQGKEALDSSGVIRLLGLERAITDVDRAAAARPPEAADADILARPIPPAARRSAATTDIPAMVDAAAGVQHYTAPPHKLSLAEFLAVTIAADTIYQRAGALLRTGGQKLTAWRTVQHRLRPFNDGTRRTQAVPSPLIIHALNLHDASTALVANSQPTRTQLTAARYALDASADVAANLRHELGRWGERRTLNAYAVDLRAGYRYPAQHLAGRCAAGIISAGPVELAPTMRALDHAQVGARRLTRRLGELQRNDFAAPRALTLSARHGEASVPNELAPQRHL